MSIPNENLFHVDFNQIFSDDQKDISLEKIIAFFDECVVIASELTKIAPNQMVRVVNRNQVTWMTQEQALKFLHESQKPDVQSDVHKALNGELKQIHQELEILLALAFYTYNQYQSNKALPKKDFQEFAPILNRRKQEIKTSIDQSTEAEAQITQKRKENPILDEFEFLMSEFQKAKNSGNTTLTAELARKLGNMKKDYLLMTKSIEPEIQSIHYQRLNLQKVKKRILNTHNQLCLSRKDQLLIDLKAIQSHFQMIKQEFEQVNRIVKTTEKSLAPEKKNKLHDVHYEFQQSKAELHAITTESKIVEKQEQACEQVIQIIAHDYLHEQKTNDTPKPIPPKPLVPKPRTPQSDTKSKRMHIRKREDPS